VPVIYDSLFAARASLCWRRPTYISDCCAKQDMLTRPILIAILICSVTILAVGQSASPRYQPGTIVAVRAHHAGAGDASLVRRYDISVKVGNTIYVVLYTQPRGTINPEYRAGLDLPVLVGSNTVRFNDRLGRSKELPILSRRTIPETRGLTELSS
jgi:hypothetical protein